MKRVLFCFFIPVFNHAATFHIGESEFYFFYRIIFFIPEYLFFAYFFSNDISA